MASNSEPSDRSSSIDKIIAGAGQVVPSTSSVDTSSVDSVSDGVREGLDSQWSSSDELEEGGGQSQVPFPPPPQVHPVPPIPPDPPASARAEEEARSGEPGAAAQPPPGSRAEAGSGFPLRPPGLAAERATAEYKNLMKIIIQKEEEQRRREEERRLQD